MPWCPKCKVEYRKGFKKCNDCNVELVEQLEPECEENKQEKWVLLTNVADGIEADLIEGLLKSNGIQVLRNYKGAGGYLKIYMGFSNMGVDLFVPSSQLEIATEIMESEPVEEES